MKLCNTCGKEKPLDSFATRKQKRSLGLQSKCKQCHKDRHAIGREFIDRHKTGPCRDCGGCFHPCAMDFDHLPGTSKLREVAKMTGSPIALIQKELDKCELVCSNCHRIRTYKRLQQAGRE